MGNEFAGRCGTYCGQCEWREKMHCPGCPAANAKMFWGECRVSKCCGNKGHEHCGKCTNFACAALNEFAYDPVQGDNGARLENLKKRNEIGTEAWLASFQKDH